MKITPTLNFGGQCREAIPGNAEGIMLETSSGYACTEFGVKNTMSTRFTIASVTKQFTAFAIMLLYDKER